MAGPERVEEEVKELVNWFIPEDLETGLRGNQIMCVISGRTTGIQTIALQQVNT